MQNQRGIALLIALILAVLLSLIGLSLTFSTITSTRITSEFESHERALMVADAGQSAARTVLRGKNIDAVLAQSISLPVFLSSDVPEAGSPIRRNPRFALEARNIDFENPPGKIGDQLIFGLLTPVLGERISLNSYSGRYFAKLTDNEDEAIIGEANDPFSDLDGKVYLRVLGINRSMPDEVRSHGSYYKNAIAIIETVIKRDMTFDLNSPLALYGQNVTANFSGNSFNVDGYDHRGMTYGEIEQTHQHPSDDEAFAGIGVIYDGAGNAGTAEHTVESALTSQQADNVTGAGGTPAVRDDTQMIRDSDNPDARNIFSPLFLLHFATLMGSIADYEYDVDTSLSGSDIQLGTADDPKITVAKGDLSILGSGSGAGILIVQGTLDIGGSFVFDGVILVVGEGNLVLHGANKALMGGVFVANVNRNSGVPVFGTPSISIQGHCDFYMKSDSIAMGYSLLPMKVLAWREITSEIEPN